MRRSLVTVNVVLVLSLFSAALFAQTPPTQQTPPAQQQPAAQQPAAPKEPRLPLTGKAAALMYTIKADQTATFEELMGKVMAALAKSDNPVRKQQSAGFKVYKAAEPAAGGNVLYLAVIDPAVPAAEYDPLVIVAESLGPDAAKPENQEMLKKYAGVFAGLNRLNLTPVGGGM
jgi:hypothetical protein